MFSFTTTSHAIATTATKMPETTASIAATTATARTRGTSAAAASASEIAGTTASGVARSEMEATTTAGSGHSPTAGLTTAPPVDIAPDTSAGGGGTTVTTTQKALTVIESVNETGSGLLQVLRDSGVPRTQKDMGGVSVTATKLDMRGSAGSDVEVTANFSGQTLDISFPRSVFADLAPSSVPGDEPALIMASFGNGSTLPTTTNSAGEEVHGAVLFELKFLLEGSDITLANLPQPVVFTIPQVDYTVMGGKRMSCFYYDEKLKVWSQEGTGLVDGNVEGEPLQCWTTHFSLFGAFLEGITDVFLCAQFHLLTTENMGFIFVGEWYNKVGALLFFGGLAMLVFIFIVASILDYRRSATMGWTDEFFLIPRQNTPMRATVAMREEQEAKGCTRRCMEFVTGFCMCCLTPCQSLRDSNALRDAMDDICSNWFESFGEARSFCEGLVAGLELSAIRSGRAFTVSHKMMCNMTLMTSRRLAGASMWLSNDVVHFVLEDDELRDSVIKRTGGSGLRLSATGEAQPQANGLQHSLTFKDTNDREEVWGSLHEEVCKNLQVQIENHNNIRTLPCAFMQLFLAHTPFGSIWVLDIFMSCKLRAFLFACELCGSFLLCALFFQASGGLRKVKSDGRTTTLAPDGEVDECAAKQQAVYIMGRLIAIALGSVIIAGLPVSFLNSLHTRSFKRFECEGSPQWMQQLRAWRYQDYMIWILGSLYLAFSIFFITLFLANVSEEDQRAFATGGLLTLFQDFVVLPAAIGFLAPALSTLLIEITRCLGNTSRSSLLRDVRHRLLRQEELVFDI